MPMTMRVALGWAAFALLSLPVAAAAAGIAGAAAPARADFCTELEGIIAQENAREASDFAPSLAAMPDAVRGERRVPTEAVLTPDEAAQVAARLWAMWVPTTPASSVAVVEDGPDAWLLAPAPGAGPPYAGAPMRIDKGTGKVTWALPHPSERERLHARMCEAGEQPP